MSDAESKAAERLRDAKLALRGARRRLTLPEKVAQVVELQRVVLPMIRRRRPLKPWERVWDLRESQARSSPKR